MIENLTSLTNVPEDLDARVRASQAPLVAGPPSDDPPPCWHFPVLSAHPTLHWRVVPVFHLGAHPYGIGERLIACLRGGLVDHRGRGWSLYLIVQPRSAGGYTARLEDESGQERRVWAEVEAAGPLAAAAAGLAEAATWTPLAAPRVRGVAR